MLGRKKSAEVSRLQDLARQNFADLQRTASDLQNATMHAHRVLMSGRELQDEIAHCARLLVALRNQINTAETIICN